MDAAGAAGSPRRHDRGRRARDRTARPRNRASSFSTAAGSGSRPSTTPRSHRRAPPILTRQRLAGQQRPHRLVPCGSARLQASPRRGHRRGHLPFTNVLYRENTLVAKHSHSQWLDVLTELGVVGFVLFALAIGGLVAAAFGRLFRDRRDPHRRCSPPARRRSSRSSSTSLWTGAGTWRPSRSRSFCGRCQRVLRQGSERCGATGAGVGTGWTQGRRLRPEAGARRRVQQPRPSAFVCSPPV